MLEKAIKQALLAVCEQLRYRIEHINAHDHIDTLDRVRRETLEEVIKAIEDACEEMG